MTVRAWFAICGIALFLGAGLSACSEDGAGDGAGERAGKAFDEAMDDAQDAAEDAKKKLEGE